MLSQFTRELSLRGSQTRAGLTEERSEGAIPVIEGRQILIDGSLSLEGVRYFLANAPAERQLQANDIILRSLVSPRARLHAAVVREDDASAHSQQFRTCLEKKAERVRR